MTPIWPAMLLAGAGTYLIRICFPAMAGRLEHVPTGVERLLRMIPPAALSALAAGPILRPGGEIDLFGPRVLAGVIALAVGWHTKSVVPTLVVGLAAITVLENL